MNDATARVDPWSESHQETGVVFTDVEHYRRRWYLDPRWFVAAAATLLVAVILYGLFGPDPPILVSPETTVITGPPAADGLPDYAAARLALAGPAPPPEDNAAVDLLLMTWPMYLSPSDLRLVCTAVGIPDSPPASRLLIPEWSGNDAVTLWTVSDASEHPWTTNEHPALAAWLETNATFLDRLVTAADKPRWWLANPALLGGSPDWFGDAPAVDALTMFLECRALLHLGEGRHAAAWRDLRAIERWGRLLADPRNGPQRQLFQLSVQSVQIRAARSIARHLLPLPALPSDLLAEIRTEFASDEAAPDPAETLRGERLQTVGMVVSLARRLPGGRSARPRRVQMGRGEVNPLVDAALATRLDWGGVLIAFTEAHDDALAALRLPTHAARRAELDRLQAGWAATAPAVRSVQANTATVLRGLIEPRRRERALAAWLAIDAFDRVAYLDGPAAVTACRELVRTTVALAAWRADRAPGEPLFPERIEDMVPRYLDHVPNDPFTDSPLRYRRVGDVVLLVSAGGDGIDNGGDDRLDIVVRMPPPPSPGVPAPPP